MNINTWNARSLRFNTGGKSGAILGMVLVLVLALSLIGLGLLNLGRVNAVEVSRFYNLSRAFWAAEAGLFDARARLRGDSSFRNGLFPTSYANTGLGYSLLISSSDNVNFGIVSTGMVQEATRIVTNAIRIEVGWPSAFDYSLFSGGTMKLAKDTSVTGDGTNGDIYANSGYAGGSKEPATNNCSIYDGVLGGYAAPSPVPLVPVFDQGPYNTLLATAVTSPNTTYPASLSGIYRVNQGITISTPMSGSGTLVVNGPVTITLGAVIGNGITIIAKGQLSITSTPSLGSNDVFYSATSISIAKDNTFSAGNSALITPGSVDIQKTFQFTGLIYAGGNIVMDKATGTTATITGCVVAGGTLTLKKDFIITYDASQLPSPILPGFSPEVVVTDGVWGEVFQ